MIVLAVMVMIAPVLVMLMVVVMVLIAPVLVMVVVVVMVMRRKEEEGYRSRQEIRDDRRPDVGGGKGSFSRVGRSVAVVEAGRAEKRKESMNIKY